MTEPSGPPRHRSFVGPLLLISVGVLILLLNLYPDFDPWPWLRYWPVILIVIGIGKIWDSYYARQHPEQPRAPWIAGTEVAWIILVLLLVLAFWHGRHWRNRGWEGPRWERRGERHETQAIELQGAKSVVADIDFPAGHLELSGGSTRLLEGDFGWYGTRPKVDYTVGGERGQLTITGSSNFTPYPWASTDNDWHLRFGGDVPIDVNLNIGAGESALRFASINLTHLTVHMGAGELDLDLTGPRKSNLEADVEGGVGSARIRLPKDVGVRVSASGGIGSVNADGLRREGDTYENEAYGKTATAIDMTVHGGVGEIDLVEQ